MQTLYGIRFMPVVRVRGTMFGLDASWLGRRGLLLGLLLVMASPGGPLSRDATLSLWVKLGVGLSSVVAVLLTSLSHELGHALAGGLAGLPVRAIVLGPAGGVTIRGSSEHAHVNVLTALAGPLANLVIGICCGWAATQVVANTLAFGFLVQMGILQLLTSVANLLPFGQFDGSRILTARRASSHRHAHQAHETGDDPVGTRSAVRASATRFRSAHGSTRRSLRTGVPGRRHCPDPFSRHTGRHSRAGRLTCAHRRVLAQLPLVSSPTNVVSAYSLNTAFVRCKACYQSPKLDGHDSRTRPRILRQSPAHR